MPAATRKANSSPCSSRPAIRPRSRCSAARSTTPPPAADCCPTGWRWQPCSRSARPLRSGSTLAGVVGPVESPQSRPRTAHRQPAPSEPVRPPHADPMVPIASGADANLAGPSRGRPDRTGRPQLRRAGETGVPTDSDRPAGPTGRLAPAERGRPCSPRPCSSDTAHADLGLGRQSPARRSGAGSRSAAVEPDGRSDARGPPIASCPPSTWSFPFTASLADSLHDELFTHRTVWS